MALAGKHRQENRRYRPVLGMFLLVAGALAACTPRSPEPSLAMLPPPAPEAAPGGPRISEEGMASWYGKRFHHKRTASGEHYDMHGYTAAHRSLPINTVVRVTNLDNQRVVLVRINDRGPYRYGRIIDLSAEAAKALDMTKVGVVPVLLEVYDADQSLSIAASMRAY